MEEPTRRRSVQMCRTLFSDVFQDIYMEEHTMRQPVKICGTLIPDKAQDSSHMEDPTRRRPKSPVDKEIPGIEELNMLAGVSYYEQFVEVYVGISNKVEESCKDAFNASLQVEEKLFLVSHPHGREKQVSLGEIKDIRTSGGFYELGVEQKKKEIAY
ncbi:hypothetical protein Btru_052885 [Bulinus truncatus]|nr:hypothetical protein Btru_052885 [Bulinus truncatus]